MLSLEGPVIFSDHSGGYVTDHGLVALHFGFGVEGLVYDEVEVAFQGMTVDAGVIVAVLVEQGRQILSSLGQVLDVEGHVLYEAGGALLAHSADGREYSGADCPVF